MRLLITGGAGFVGTHLCKALVAAHHDVTSLDIREPTHKVPHVTYVTGDICDHDIVGHLMQASDQTYHLASVVGFANVMKDMRRTIETSAIGTANVLHYAAQLHQPVLFTSTSACYGRGAPQVAVKEDDDGVLGPTCKTSWSYAYAKACDEALAFAYHREYGVPVTVARLFNTVGPGQSAGAGFVLPRFVGQALRGEALTVHTPGTQTRTFVHVKDTVTALVGLMNNPATRGELVNVGGTETWGIRQLAARVKLVLGSNSTIDMIEAEYDPHNYDNIHDRRPDTTKLYNLTGWHPLHTMDDMITDVARELVAA